MVGSNVNHWTDEQILLMQQLRAGGIGWDHVALRVGHPVPSCRSTMSTHRHWLRRMQAKAERQALREVADSENGFVPKPPAAKQALPPPKPAPEKPAVKIAERDYMRSSASTARLVVDADLRRRIAVLGVTGGLPGDPEPGRSALDRRGMR